MNPGGQLSSCAIHGGWEPAKMGAALHCLPFSCEKKYLPCQFTYFLHLFLCPHSIALFGYNTIEFLNQVFIDRFSSSNFSLCIWKRTQLLRCSGKGKTWSSSAPAAHKDGGVLPSRPRMISCNNREICTCSVWSAFYDLNKEISIIDCIIPKHWVILRNSVRVWPRQFSLDKFSPFAQSGTPSGRRTGLLAESGFMSHTCPQN